MGMPYIILDIFKKKENEEETAVYDKIYSVIQSVDDFVWGWGMIVLLLGTHIFLTMRTGFIQRKTITKGIPLSVSKEEGADGEVSQFGALATALASTIGTGNIIGVGTAIALGGPGAVLWCWLTGVFGIATKYAESLIAVKYRVKTPDGRMQGGAMYALERGLNMKWLGMIFAVFRRIRVVRYRMRDSGECHRGSLQYESGDRAVDRRRSRCSADSICYFRRDQINRKCV